MHPRYQLGQTTEELEGKIEVYDTTLPGVKKIRRKITHDHRGHYGELYSKKIYFANGVTVDFTEGEQDCSCSRKNTLRGLHGDSRTWKLITCLFGRFHLVVLNYNPASALFGRWEGFDMSAEEGWQILIPPRHCNGHLILSDIALFHYNQSEYYSGPELQNVIKWDDPRFNIDWPIENKSKLLLSPRDSQGASYSDLSAKK